VRRWQLPGVCDGHNKPHWREELRPGACVELRMHREPHSLALCPSCAQIEYFLRTGKTEPPSTEKVKR